jgi:hypothetical protein
LFQEQGQQLYGAKLLQLQVLKWHSNNEVRL